MNRKPSHIGTLKLFSDVRVIVRERLSEIGEHRRIVGWKLDRLFYRLSLRKKRLEF